MWYLAGYGLGRFVCEWLRTDKLYISGTSVDISLLISGVLVVVFVPIVTVRRVMVKKRADIRKIRRERVFREEEESRREHSVCPSTDKVVDIIMYAKDKVAEQDISDEQIREIIQAGEETAGVTLTEEEENKLINIVKEIKNADINEEQLRSTVNKVYDKLEEMGIGKKEVKGILQKLIEFAKNILE